MNTSVRKEGPAGPGGFVTVAGKAGDKDVHWLGTDLAHASVSADQHEATFATASELKRLLVRNAYTLEGLSAAEVAHARELIIGAPEVEKRCWVCAGEEKAAIGDTGLCRGHNLYALLARK